VHGLEVDLALAGVLDGPLLPLAGGGLLVDDGALDGALVRAEEGAMGGLDGDLLAEEGGDALGRGVLGVGAAHGGGVAWVGVRFGYDLGRSKNVKPIIIAVGANEVRRAKCLGWFRGVRFGYTVMESRTELTKTGTTYIL
jgi:hypothetical protein